MNPSDDVGNDFLDTFIDVSYRHRSHDLDAGELLRVVAAEFAASHAGRVWASHAECRVIVPYELRHRSGS